MSQNKYTELAIGLFEMMGDVITSLIDVWEGFLTIIQLPMSVLADYVSNLAFAEPLKSVVDIFFDFILQTLGWRDLTILEIMFGSGLLTIVIFAIIRFFKFW